ncbi:MAG: hypothetical protein R6X12_10255 [bacterium]
MCPQRIDIGICRETKNRWERRTPLTPGQVGEAVCSQGLQFAVQSSSVRAFPDEEYREVGAEVTEDLSNCRVVLGVKEMPVELFRPGGSYAFFAHVIKGQRYNMPMLSRLVELGCSLLDYELIADEGGRRLVFFGRFAGIAGMVETLVALGRRLASEGFENPLAGLRPPHEYEHVDALMRAVAATGLRLRREGLPNPLVPLVVGVAGYGHVGQGALEVLDAFGAVPVEPDEVPAVFGRGARTAVYRTVFREQHLAEPLERGKPFNLDEYYRHPERFRPAFEDRLPYLTVLVNAIFWTDRYPRLVTREWLRTELSKPDGLRLRVVGDISCDVRGAIEATVRVTDPERPVFVYDPGSDSAVAGVDGPGLVVMAVDNLPCELPIDSSLEFGRALMPFVTDLARTDFGTPGGPELPSPLARALVLRRGELTEKYRYLADYLG